ncbi:MAG: hypothetical protein GXY24_00840 [Bacteroidales bacterium]|jgi:hypothetical protein|nr:hypothetical protein [Bacteroidales bacterium]
MKTGGVIIRFLLGMLLSWGIMAALLFFSLPLDGPGFLSRAFEEGPTAEMMQKTQDIWGWVLLGMILLALAGLLACPVKGFSSKRGRQSGLRLLFPAFCGTLILLALLEILCVPAFFTGFLQFGRWYGFATIAGSVLLVLLMYFLGSRCVPLVRSVEALGNGCPRGIRIAEGLLVAFFSGAAVYFAWHTMRWYLLPAGILLALLPGTLCEWALARRRSGVRIGYLCLRTLRGIGLVVFFPVTIPVLLYALFKNGS